jgi:hypothetical protein
VDGCVGVSKENSLSEEEEKKVKYFSAIFFAKDFWTMIFLNEAKFFSSRKSLEFSNRFFRTIRACLEENKWRFE